MVKSTVQMSPCRTLQPPSYMAILVSELNLMLKTLAEQIRSDKTRHKGLDVWTEIPRRKCLKHVDNPGR